MASVRDTVWWDHGDLVDGVVGQVVSLWEARLGDLRDVACSGGGVAESSSRGDCEDGCESHFEGLIVVVMLVLQVVTICWIFVCWNG